MSNGLSYDFSEDKNVCLSVRLSVCLIMPFVLLSWLTKIDQWCPVPRYFLFSFHLSASWCHKYIRGARSFSKANSLLASYDLRTFITSRLCYCGYITVLFKPILSQMDLLHILIYAIYCRITGIVKGKSKEISRHALRVPGGWAS